MNASIIISSATLLSSCAPMVPYLQLAEVVEEAVVHEIYGAGTAQGPQSPPPPKPHGMNGPAGPSAS